MTRYDAPTLAPMLEPGTTIEFIAPLPGGSELRFTGRIADSRITLLAPAIPPQVGASVPLEFEAVP